MPSLPVPATTSAPLPFLRPNKQTLHLCSEFPPQNRVSRQRQQPRPSPQTLQAPTDGHCSSACPACLHSASELRALSGRQLPLSHHLHPAYSARTENCPAKGLIKSLSQRINLQNDHHTCIYLERTQDKKRSDSRCDREKEQ